MIEDAELLDIVSIFVRRLPGVPGGALVTAFATIVPFFEAHGILRADQIVPVVAVLTSEA